MSEAPTTPRGRRLVTEAVQTVEAIRRGEVDAFVVADGGEEDRVFVLRSADRLYRLIVESMGEAAVTLSDDGVVTYCNPYFVTLLARDRDEILGRPMRDLLTEETRAVFDTVLRTAARGEVEFSSPEGPIPVALAVTVLDDFDGSQYCMIVNDLRDQRSREQLRAAKEAAEVANRAKDDFLAMVSHELRSPITVILGWTRMLQMNRVDRDTLALGIDNIHHSTARLLKLVEDILDASRLSSGKITLQTEAVDLRDIVRQSLDSVRFEVEQKPLRVSEEIIGEPAMVLGDPDRLQQIVVNLLANAIKFTPAHGTIDLSLTRIDGVVRLRIADSGEGIDPSFLPHVFERFRQDDSSTTRAHKGLGLGLAIVKQLVEAHDGSVAAHSDGKGSGATFTVMLPTTAEARSSAAAATAEPLPSLDSIRVLLVDDEPETVDVMREILRTAGASVDSATSVARALELAATFDPHVIVSDIAMPGEDGFQFLRRLSVRAADRAAMPVVAITGKSTQTDRDTILAAGFHAYLAKPIEPEALIRAIASLAKR